MQLHTTDEVLCELLNYFAEKGSHLRQKAVGLVRRLLKQTPVRVHPQTRDTFNNALELYEDRADKGFSLVDCVSFQCMERLGIKEALTNDHHFEQAGFRALLDDA